MINKLIELSKMSYAPYSNFHVSAIVVTKDNNEFHGVNVENASYGASICSERTAILQAVTKGYRKGDFKELHVLCRDSKTISPCCFQCRQVISEFYDKDALVYCYNANGEYKKYTVSELCPYPFSEDDLK